MFTNKDNVIIEASLSAETITYLSKREDKHSFTFLSLNTDLDRASIHHLSLWIRRINNDRIDLTRSDNEPSSSSSFRTHIQAYGIYYYFTIVVPVDVMWFPEFRSMLDDLTYIIMVDYIQVARPDGLYLNDWEQCFF